VKTTVTAKWDNKDDNQYNKNFVKISAKGIIDFLVLGSKDWLNKLFADEAKRRPKLNPVFSSVSEVLTKIQKHCAEKQIAIFDVATKLPPNNQPTAKPVVQSLQPQIKAPEVVKPKAKPVAKKVTVAITCAKWTADEQEFPPLESSKSSHNDKTELLDFDKIVLERSLKSTIDTVENKSAKLAQENCSNTINCQQSNSEQAVDKSLNGFHNDQFKQNLNESEKSQDKNSQHKLALKNERKISESFELSQVENQRDRSSRSVRKHNQRAESPKQQKSSSSHQNSPIKKKTADGSSDFVSNKTSIDRHSNTKSEKDQISTFDVSDCSNLKTSDIEEYIEKHQDCLTNLDIKILESMNKCNSNFERCTSRYNFASDKSPSKEEKLKQCQKFSNLIFSFLLNNPLEDAANRTEHRQSEPGSKEFRLFDQSYTLVIPKKST
jgi:hypothetical protein